MTILQTIVAAKRGEVARSKARLPEATLAKLALRAPQPQGFKHALQRGAGPAVIAEVKRASPSKGVLRPQDPVVAWQPEHLAKAYAEGGACCLSVLTDVHFFWGHPDAIGACRDVCSLPILRKDFIIDPYQVLESRYLGADAILLIVRILDTATLVECANRAQSLGMDVLVELHEEADLPAAFEVPLGIIGVNNRDLHKFTVDPLRAARLRKLVPKEQLVVAESGIDDPHTVKTLLQQGVNGFLVGEFLVRADDPKVALQRLRGGS